jgi:hypothetical protein
MSWLSNLFSGFLSHDSTSSLSQPHCPSVNPATGLPMANCSIDVEGNPYGTSSMEDEDLSPSINLLNQDDFDDTNDMFNSWSDDDNWASHSWDDS